MVLGLDKRFIWALVPLSGYALGHFLDKKETQRMVLFRDKSALYGSDKKEPSW